MCYVLSAVTQVLWWSRIISSENWYGEAECHMSVFRGRGESRNIQRIREVFVKTVAFELGCKWRLTSACHDEVTGKRTFYTEKISMWTKSEREVESMPVSAEWCCRRWSPPSMESWMSFTDIIEKWLQSEPFSSSMYLCICFWSTITYFPIYLNFLFSWCLGLNLCPRACQAHNIPRRFTPSHVFLAFEPMFLHCSVFKETICK